MLRGDATQLGMTLRTGSLPVDRHATRRLSLAPFWRQIPPKTPPRCVQDALGRPSLVPKRTQEAPKRRPRGAKNRPRAAPEASRKRPTSALGRRHATKHPQTPSRPRFWTILATIWKDFGIILDRSFKGISNKLDRRLKAPQDA